MPASGSTRGAGWCSRRSCRRPASSRRQAAAASTQAIIAERVLSWRAGIDERLRGIPGVTSVATTATLPFGTDRDGVLYVGVQGAPVDPEHPQVARAHRVSREFFDALGIKVIAGRGFSADDRIGTAPVAVVNRTFVKRYLGDRDPLASRFTAGYPGVPAAPILTIVGVVDDVKYVSVAQPGDPAYYLPEARARTWHRRSSSTPRCRNRSAWPRRCERPSCQPSRRCRSHRVR